MRKRFDVCVLVWVIAIAVAQNVSAQDVSVDVETFVVAPDGSRIVATSARHGDIVEYVLTATNRTATTLPAGTVAITAPVATGTRYVQGFATSGSDLLLEYSSDGDTFTEQLPANPTHLRWTYLRPLEPNAKLVVTYRVRVDQLAGDTSTLIYAFTQAMFGHLGIVEVDCPPEFSAVERSFICGETSRPFDSFRELWDLYADWQGRVPVTPSPVTAWRRADTGYNRGYRLDDNVFVVFFFDGFVVVSY